MVEGAVSDLQISSTAITCRSRWQKLTALHRGLQTTIEEFQPALVCHLPYGTFRHLYGLINLWTMRRIDRACGNFGALCFTVMYSISQEADTRKLRPSVKHLVLNQFRDGFDDKVVRLGLDFAEWPALQERRSNLSAPRLLFMAGMWQPTKKRLEHVLNVRGLRLILQAGAELSKLGMQLTVAAPLLDSMALQSELRLHSDNTWPAAQLELTGHAQVPNIYMEHDLFIFPYMREETQFTPTSVVEAMRAGTPVVLPNLDFLRTLGGEERYAFTYSAGNLEALTRTIIAAMDDRVRYSEVRRRAFEHVGETLSIESSCEDLLTLYKKSTQPGDRKSDTA